MWRHFVFAAAFAVIIGHHSSFADQPASPSIGVNELGLPVSKPQKPETVNAQGAYKHLFTDLVFPTEAGAFKRTVIVQYDKDGMDMSANYETETQRGKIVASVYIYPVTSIVPDARPQSVEDQQLCRDIYDNTVKEAQSSFVNPWPRGLESATGSLTNYRAIFDADSWIPRPDFTSHDGVLTSELYLNCEQVKSHADGSMKIDRRWLVKYRITYPHEIDARSLIDDWIAAVLVGQSTTH